MVTDAPQRPRRSWPWLLAAVSALLVGWLVWSQWLNPSGVRHVFFDPQDETFPVEVTGYYGYNGERVEFRHIIECRKAIYRGANRAGAVTWTPNTKLFVQHNPDGSTLIYGFHAGRQDKFAAADFHCSDFHDDPDLEIERYLQIAWIDDIKTFGSVYYARSRWTIPTDFSGLITRGRVSARRIATGAPDPVDPMVHWAYPMMYLRDTDALGFDHAEHARHEIIRGGFYYGCVLWSVIVDDHRKTGHELPPINPTPLGFVENLCGLLDRTGANYLPLIPVGDDPYLVSVDSTGPNLWHYHTSPDVVRDVANSRQPLTIRTDLGTVSFHAWTRGGRKILACTGGAEPVCMSVFRSYLDVSASAAARLVKGE